MAEIISGYFYFSAKPLCVLKLTLKWNIAENVELSISSLTGCLEVEKVPSAVGSVWARIP